MVVDLIFTVTALNLMNNLLAIETIVQKQQYIQQTTVVGSLKTIKNLKQVHVVWFDPEICLATKIIDIFKFILSKVSIFFFFFKFHVFLDDWLGIESAVFMPIFVLVLKIGCLGTTNSSVEKIVELFDIFSFDAFVFS